MEMDVDLLLFPQAWCPLWSKVWVESDPGHRCWQTWYEYGLSSHKLCDFG